MSTTTTTTHPLLMSPPMVRAVLAGKKTQTRRLLDHVDHANVEFLGCGAERDEHFEYIAEGAHSGPGWYVSCSEYPDEGVAALKTYQPGDLFAVRETFATSQALDKVALTDAHRYQGWPLWYRADGASVWRGSKEGGPAFMTRGRWRPSIHMRFWCARIRLPLVRMRYERLQRITLADIMAEGIEVPPVSPHVTDDPRHLDQEREDYARKAFAALWDQLNGTRAPWKSNPPVRVLEFPPWVP